MQNGNNEINIMNHVALLLRSQSTVMSKQDVIGMIKKYNYYDVNKNPTGQGILHNYTLHVKNGNKIVIDNKTNLMWQQSGYTYKIESLNADKYIKDINNKGYGGYRDWRLPTLEEAMSLIEHKNSTGGLHINSIFNKKQGWIWTSDFYKNKKQTWYVSFLTGNCGNVKLFNYGYENVRAVRSLQPS